MLYQLLLPHIHRRNTAKQAMETWKDNFFGVLFSTDSNLPLHIWGQLINQVDIPLDMLRPCNQNLQMPEYTVLEGAFGFNKTPMDPPGTKVIIHVNRYQRV